MKSISSFNVLSWLCFGFYHYFIHKKFHWLYNQGFSNTWIICQKLWIKIIKITKFAETIKCIFVSLVLANEFFFFNKIWNLNHFFLTAFEISCSSSSTTQNKRPDSLYSNSLVVFKEITYVQIIYVISVINLVHKKVNIWVILTKC